MAKAKVTARTIREVPPQRNPIGANLRLMRERAQCSRCYIKSRLGLPYGTLSQIENGYDEPDQSIIDGYIVALEHLRRNSLNDSVAGHMVWRAIGQYNAPRW